MKCNDVLSGVLAGAFALAVFVGAQGFPTIPGRMSAPRYFRN